MLKLFSAIYDKLLICAKNHFYARYIWIFDIQKHQQLKHQAVYFARAVDSSF